jgi:hypothetical protein
MSLAIFLADVLDAIGRDVKVVETAVANLGGGGPKLGVHAGAPGLIGGSYCSAQVNATALTTVAAAAGRLDFIPFIPMKSITVNELALEVTTLLAGSLAKIGIYASDGNGNPSALIVGTGNLDCATLGAKTAVIANTVLILNTVYWLAVHSSATQTYRALAVAALLPLGHPATLNTTHTLRRATAAFAGGLPVNAPATVLTASVAPWVRLKIA